MRSPHLRFVRGTEFLQESGGGSFKIVRWPMNRCPDTIIPEVMVLISTHVSGSDCLIRPWKAGRNSWIVISESPGSLAENLHLSLNDSAQRA